MRYRTIVLGLALLAGCNKAEKPAAEPAATPPPPPVPEPVRLADVAGVWTLKGMSPTGDSLLSYTITATADTTGWTITLPGRKPMALKVWVAGDSIVTDAGPFESVLRPGVKVSTHAVMRISGDKMTGTTTAHYQTTGADSVATLLAEGTRQK